MRTSLLVVCLFCGGLFAQSAREFQTQAAQLVQRHQWKEALDLLERGVELHPQDAGILLQVGTLLVQTGRSSSADYYLYRALALRPADPDVLLALGENRLRQGDFAASLPFFREVLRQRADAQAHKSLAFALMLEGKNKEALRQARSAVEIDPSDVSLHSLLSQLLDLNGEPGQAIQELKVAYRLKPRNAGILLQISDKERMAGRLNQALEFMAMASEADPENPVYHNHLAKLYARLGDPDSARQEAQLGRSLEGAFDAYVRALQLRAQGKTGAAISILRPQVEQFPEFVTGALLLADLYHRQGDTQKALDLYLEIVARDPQQESAREEGAWIQAQRGMLDSAVRLLQGSRHSGQNLRLLEAYRRLAQRDWTGATAVFKKAAIKDPLNPALLKMIAYCLSRQGRSEEALKYLEKVRGLRPHDSEVADQEFDVQFDRGHRLMGKEDWDGALAVFDRLARAFPAKAEPFFNRAYCRQRLGHIREAILDYREGLRLDSTSNWARANLATCLYLRERYQESAIQYEIVARQHPSPQLVFQLGLCYSHLQRTAEAETAFRQARHMGLDSTELKYNLGLTQFRLGRMRAGLYLIQQAARGRYRPAQDFLREYLARGGSLVRCCP